MSNLYWHQRKILRVKWKQKMARTLTHTQSWFIFVGRHEKRRRKSKYTFGKRRHNTKAALKMAKSTVATRTYLGIKSSFGFECTGFLRFTLLFVILHSCCFITHTHTARCINSFKRPATVLMRVLLAWMPDGRPLDFFPHLFFFCSNLNSYI